MVYVGAQPLYLLHGNDNPWKLVSLSLCERKILALYYLRRLNIENKNGGDIPLYVQDQLQDYVNFQLFFVFPLVSRATKYNPDIVIQLCPASCEKYQTDCLILDMGIFSLLNN